MLVPIHLSHKGRLCWGEQCVVIYGLSHPHIENSEHIFNLIPISSLYWYLDGSDPRPDSSVQVSWVLSGRVQGHFPVALGSFLPAMDFSCAGKHWQGSDNPHMWCGCVRLTWRLFAVTNAFVVVGDCNTVMRTPSVPFIHSVPTETETCWSLKDYEESPNSLIVKRHRKQENKQFRLKDRS